MAEPLILTLALHDEDQARFDRLRQLHFPPERNFIPAHVTLFHHLPGEEMATVQAELEGRAAAQAPFGVAVTGLRFLGRGVAYELQSPELSAFRRALAGRWAQWLTAQDQQGFRPHVTIQNKATPEAARALRDAMQAGFAPFSVRATGVLLWRYLGGPWQEASRHPFAGRDTRRDTLET